MVFEMVSSSQDFWRSSPPTLSYHGKKCSPFCCHFRLTTGRALIHFTFFRKHCYFQAKRRSTQLMPNPEKTKTVPRPPAPPSTMILVHLTQLRNPCTALRLIEQGGRRGAG